MVRPDTGRRGVSRAPRPSALARRSQSLCLTAGGDRPPRAGGAHRPGDHGLRRLRRATGAPAAGPDPAPLFGRAARRAAAGDGPRHLFRARHRARDTGAVLDDRPGGLLRPYGVGGRAGTLRRHPGVPARRATRNVGGGGPDPARDPDRHRAAGRPHARPGRAAVGHRLRVRAGPAGCQHRGAGRGGAPARHPGTPDGPPEPPAARARTPPADGLGGHDRPDLGGRHGDGRGQDADEVPAGGGRSARAERVRRGIRRRRRLGPSRHRRSRRGQAAVRPPRREGLDRADRPRPRWPPPSARPRRCARRCWWRPTYPAATTGCSWSATVSWPPRS